MKRRAVVLALFALVLAGYLVLDYGGRATPTLVEEVGAQGAVAGAEVSGREGQAATGSAAESLTS